MHSLKCRAMLALRVASCGSPKIPIMLIMRDFEAHRPGPEPDDLGAMVRAYIAYYQHRWCVTLMWRRHAIRMGNLGIERMCQLAQVSRAGFYRYLQEKTRSASLLGLRRRCRLARAFFPLASSLDFLQGTFEKIYLQCFFRQQPLKLVNFLAQC